MLVGTDLERDSLGEEPDVEDVAAESLVRSSGMTMDQAKEALRFQSAAHRVLDDVEGALGTDLGGVWFDHGRLKIGVVSDSDPPSGPGVETAKQILLALGLLDRVDFIRARWTLEQLTSAQEHAWEVLEPLAVVTQIMTRVDVSKNSLVIETADDLTEEQLQTVEAAVGAAGVSVRVQASLGPSPDPSLPPVPVQWALSTVGPDLRSLVVHFSGGHAIREAVVSVRESDEEISIGVTIPDPGSSPATATPAILIRRAEIVELRSPIAGRRLTVPEGSPSWRGVRHTMNPPNSRWVQLVPRVLGLAPADADHLLREQELVPRHTCNEGRQVVAQDPEPDTATEAGVEVTLTVGTTG